MFTLPMFKTDGFANKQMFNFNSFFFQKKNDKRLYIKNMKVINNFLSEKVNKSLFL